MKDTQQQTKTINASIVILIFAYLLLIPGVSLTVIDLTGTVERADLAKLAADAISSSDGVMGSFGPIASRLIEKMDVSGSIVVYEQTRSILGTVKTLASEKNYLVSFLVLLFSVLVPIGKGVLLFIARLKKNQTGQRAQRIADLISKWSMADVFVVALFITYLAANANGSGGPLVTFDAQFGAGFYFFLGYCLLSLLSSQWNKFISFSDRRPAETG